MKYTCYFDGCCEPRKINLENIKIFGEHNLENISAAIVVAKLLKVSDATIKKSILSFKGVPNRQEFVREFKGVKYFNDTTATIPEAVIAAINSFSKRFLNAKMLFLSAK